ncbi:hypothetical protein CC1G_03715 [Coprinopsis cinerea okayama7|uniref:PXA domain-containing protein n=1 Tax=Coprinopsis cinerea (strain Okayama-7 / 130 / ATCC MYA-4618 / FGSC 9003) TaxID=240176 RepID=A8N222_COPC7|nr:hypothetical protein CC1G_03715 [Coprinopsis cinerea okayama7\|eukprot:XP_001828921.2 hypothetical protein CC1G_03715 [Coprinopsis cinerea okayama7\
MTPPPRQRQAHSIASSVPTKATQQTLARRLLVPPHSNEDLPQLLSTPGLLPELTAELYDFIALALRAYVNPWWTKLTRYDKEFLPHINKIIVHVIGNLEERLKAVDLPALVFHDLPSIITQHYVDYRNAQSKLSTSYACGGASSLSTLFAQMQPHMAISPDGKIDPEYYRQIFDQVLKLCLPPEDYEPEVERTIVREILIKVFVNDVIPKISQPWFIHKSILDLIGPLEETLYSPPQTSQNSTQESSFFHNFVVVVLSALQSFSGICLALMHSYKQTVNTIKMVNQSPSHSPRPDPAPFELRQPKPTNLRLPPSLANSRSLSTTTTSTVASINDPEANFVPLLPLPPREYNNCAGPPLAMICEIIRSEDRFSSTLLFTTISMVSLSISTFLDKLCHHLLYQFLSPAFILNITRLSKRTLFPNGYPGPPPVEPTAEEQAELRARLVAWRPKGALDPLSEAQCNTRLVIFVLDRILLALFPELLG